MSRKTVYFTLFSVLAISLSSCSKKKDDPFKRDELSYKGINLYFNSSDENMNKFLNDFTHRNMRYDQDATGEFAVGAGTGFAKNWESMAVTFQNACKQAYREDKIDKIASYLIGVSQDEYGMVYNTPLVFEASDSEVGDNKTYSIPQGWPFPSWQNSVSEVSANGNLNYTHTAEFNFNSSHSMINTGALEEKDYWHVENGTFSIGTDTKETGYGHFATNGSVQANKSFKFYRNGLDIYLPYKHGIDTRYAPIIDLEMGYTGTNLKDYGIYFKVASNPSVEYFAPQSIFASTRNTNVNGNHYIRQFFDMYMCDGWNNQIVTEIGVKFVGKDTGTFSVSDGRINYLRPSYDTRQSNATYQFILALYNYYIFTRDMKLLVKLMPIARRGTLFLSHVLEGEKGLLSLEYLYGHDGVAPRCVDPNDRMSCHGVANGYWDLCVSPMMNLEANTYFYQALKAMAVLEDAMKNVNGDNKSTISIRYRIPTENHEEIPYIFDSNSLNTLANEVKTNMEKDYHVEEVNSEDLARYNKYTPGDYLYKNTGGFYNPTTGRFISGINEHTGELLDFGYTYLNLEAVCAGIGTSDQQLSIMKWIDGQREVSGDLSKGKDIYFYEFAPRFNTIDCHNYLGAYSDETLFRINDDPTLTTSWSRQVQNGGAVIAWSYYDLVARSKVFGAENALKRLDEIKDWYLKVLDKNGHGYRFYSKYYEDLDAKVSDDPNMKLVYTVQAANGYGPGSLGLDAEFIESVILIRAIPDALYGMNATVNNVLEFTCNENNLHSYFEIFNMKYGDAVYSLRSKKDTIEVFNVNGIVDHNFKITFKYKTNNTNLKVSVNNEVYSNVSYENGYAYITVPFGNVKVVFG